jgi:hypothetical protein
MPDPESGTTMMLPDNSAHFDSNDEQSVVQSLLERLSEEDRHTISRARLDGKEEWVSLQCSFAHQLMLIGEGM